MISDVKKKTKIVSGDIFQECPQFCTRTDIRTAGSTRMLELLFAKLSRSHEKSPANIHNQYNQNKSIRGQGHRVGATVNTVLLCCHSRRIEMLLDFFRKLALINIPCYPENLMFIKSCVNVQ